jgi:hypothetical protein
MGGLSLGVGGISGSDEKIGDSHESIETGLGGRDPAVLIARDSLPHLRNGDEQRTKPGPGW